MDRLSILKKAQLKAAMEAQEMGIDPDKIMVTFTPDEFYQMYNDSEDVHFELKEENVEAFPISLLGSSSVLYGYDFSVNAFSDPYRENIIDLYNKIIETALLKADERDYSLEQLARQIAIQDTLAKAIQAAIEYYTKEYESDEKAYESAVNSIQRYELGSDVNRSKFALNKVTLTKKKNDHLTNFLIELLNELRKR